MASNTSLPSNIRRVNGQVVLQVYLLDNSMKQLLVDDWATTNDVINQMCMKLSIKDTKKWGGCFSLHDCQDGVTISHPFRKDVPVIPIIQAWGSNTRARLVFRIKLFMDSIMDTTDRAITYLLYIQSAYNVITGIYPTSADDAISLAALQVQAKFGDHKPEVHTKGYLSHQLKGLVPAPLYQLKAPSQWEAEILERHAMLNDDACKTPAKMYSQILRTREYFGCEFFRVRQSFTKQYPDTPYLGINLQGISLLDDQSKAILNMYSLPRIYRWGFKPDKVFYFEMKPSETKKGQYYEVATIEGAIICDLLTDYAEQLLCEIQLKKENGNSDSTTDNATETEAQNDASSIKPYKSPDEKAAIAIQALYRAYKVRDGLQREYAAIKIQAQVRGLLARCRFDRMLEEMEAELE